jgi:hypothetical protein
MNKYATNDRKIVNILNSNESYVEVNKEEYEELEDIF